MTERTEPLPEFERASNRGITAACKTVGLLQDFSLEPEFGNTGLDLVVWWASDSNRKSEGEKIAVRPPTPAAIGLRTLSFGDSLQGTPWRTQ